MSSDAPLQVVIRTATPEEASKAATKTVVVGPAPFAGKVASVEYIPAAELKGAETNFRTLEIVNKGNKGEGSTVAASLAFSKGTVVAPAFTATAIPLSVVEGATSFNEGDVLAFESVLTGEGIVEPAGQIVVTLERS